MQAHFFDIPVEEEASVVVVAVICRKGEKRS